MAATNYVHPFPLRGVNRIIRAARRASRFPDDAFAGWRKSPVDPCGVLAAFPSLRLRPDYTLRAYSFTEGGNGNAFVYAMPVDSAFLEPEECPKNVAHFLEPPVPPGAIGNIMEVVEGDGSPLSYLSASFFAREIGEFGARWHGCLWSTHSVLGAHPINGRRRVSKEMTTDPGDWTWLEGEPRSWLPTVVMTEPITVRFYSYSALDQERIVRHIDTYDRGTDGFEAEETEIANGPGGFVF